MKKFRGTAIFLGLALALAGYTYWEYKKAEMHSGDTAQEKRLFFFTPETVQNFRISHGTELIEVAREGADEWKLLQPVKDLADRSAVEALLYSIMIQKGRTFRDAEEAKSTKWSEFGLDPAGSIIEVNMPKKTESLLVSSKNAYDGSYFLRFGDELLLGDHALAQIVQRNPSSLRAKKLFRTKDIVILSAKVEVANDKIKDSFSITRAGDTWTIEPKPSYPLDSAKLETWLSSLHALTASEVASEALTEQQKRDFLLLKPSLKVELKVKSDKDGESSWTLTLGQDRDDDIFALVSDRSTVYKLVKGAVQNLRVNREFFRNGKAPFKFPLERAALIETGGYEIAKQGSSWSLRNAKADEELNQDKLTLFLQYLAGLEAQTFGADKRALGFQPGQRVTVRDEKGGVLLDLSWGDEFKATESWNKGMTFRFVKTNLEKEVMGVNSAKIASLTSVKLVNKRESKTEKK